MADIDRLSRRVPCLCKVAPTRADVHMEDVHRAGGIMAILGELDRAGLLDASQPTVHAPTLADALDAWDLARADGDKVRTFYRAAPGGVPPQTAFSQYRRWEDLARDRNGGVIRSPPHPFNPAARLADHLSHLPPQDC